MKLRHDWKARVLEQARKTAARNLAPHAVDELAAHLEDMVAALPQGCADGGGPACWS